MIYTKTIISILSLWIFLGTSLLISKTERIMPLGDSLTEGVTDIDGNTIVLPTKKRSGYRNYLWEKLKTKNYAANFVGSLHSGTAITPKFDADHEGHAGWTSHEIAQKVYGYLSKAKPSIILLHIGTNDRSKSTSGVESILNEVDHYERNSGERIRVIVSMIIDRQSHDSTIASFNHNLQKLVISRWENGDILTLVNMYKDAKLTKKNYVNNTHLNNGGYSKMAQVWFKAITTPYVEFTSAPTAKDDQVSSETGTSVTINVLLNDKDRQDDIDIKSVRFLDKKNKKTKKLVVKNEGTWSVDDAGIVTFKPKKGFTTNPTSVKYTVKDSEGEVSKPAKISISYDNTSLNTFPSTLVKESHIESTSINKASNSIELIVRVPNIGITF